MAAPPATWLLSFKPEIHGVQDIWNLYGGQPVQQTFEPPHLQQPQQVTLNMNGRPWSCDPGLLFDQWEFPLYTKRNPPPPLTLQPGDRVIIQVKHNGHYRVRAQGVFAGPATGPPVIHGNGNAVRAYKIKLRDFTSLGGEQDGLAMGSANAYVEGEPTVGVKTCFNLSTCKNQPGAAHFLQRIEVAGN